MAADLPLGLLAELTYRCPLACPYCSNPLEAAGRGEELGTTQWCDVLTAAAELGVLQVHLTGGEPLVRRDLPAIAAHARNLGLYVNLVTSGVRLSPAAADRLAAAGVDHVQLSVQDAAAASSDAIAGTPSFERKLAAAEAVRRAGLPLTVNVVLHRANLGSIPALVDLAVRLGAARLELAHAQYYGWALVNRVALLPTAEQVAAADRAVAAARAASGDALEIVYVVADYHSGLPKPCMNGWGRRQLVVAPDGSVLPCPVAAEIPNLPTESVLRRPLGDIWTSSPLFTAFRGFDWMREPCASCPRREEDFGGCRCQAWLLTGDPAATDPACRLSPHHHLVAAAAAGAARAGSLTAVRRPHAIPSRS